ncbi:hypothetical protein R3P38DRAFT_3171360 [Favolaschia claudopus]|uniref:Uncharacterized protein n=1 Tax=Favolaschia claudopus TaxID=2862362 RepID=A0AAW0DQN0_9AGAR
MSDTHELRTSFSALMLFKLSAMQVSIGRLLIAGRNVHRFLQKYVDSPIDSELAAPQAMQSIKLHRFNPNGTLEHKSVAAGLSTSYSI